MSYDVRVDDQHGGFPARIVFFELIGDTGDPHAVAVLLKTAAAYVAESRCVVYEVALHTGEDRLTLNLTIAV